MSANFIGMNPRNPFPRAIAKELSAAREGATKAKASATATIGQFHQLDGAKNGDTPIDVNTSTDVVSVQTPSELPKTAMEKMTERLSPPDPENPVAPKMAVGESRADSKGLAEGNVIVAQGEQTEAFNYVKRDDGTEIYHAPTPEGYAVVRENQGNGTLFVEMTDGPNLEGFNYANSSDFKAPEIANKAENADEGKLSDLWDMTDGRTSKGTVLEGVSQRFKTAGNILGGLFGGGEKKE